ncbi:hypothetical protein BOX15_Mlig015754g1, partial [Macrostomum lignano]
CYFIGEGRAERRTFRWPDKNARQPAQGRHFQDRPLSSIQATATMKKHPSLGAVSAFAALLLLVCASVSLASRSERDLNSSEADRRFFELTPLTAEQRLPSGRSVSLRAHRLVRSDRRRVWASLGRPRLVRGADGRVFRPTAGGGFTVRLLLRHPADDAALVSAASSAAESPVSACQIVRVSPTHLACAASPEGRVQQVRGEVAAADLRAGRGRLPASVMVHFGALVGLRSPQALEELQRRGRVTCRLAALHPAGSRGAVKRLEVLLASTVQLRVEDAIQLTGDLLLAAVAPTPSCGPHLPRIDLLAVYNFRSGRRVSNLAPGGRGRFQVVGRGRVRFTEEGAELPGESWLQVDTEGGALTEHMRFGSRWSVFFLFRTSGSHRRASLFSLHANNNPKACSALAWTSVSRTGQQDSVYTRLHNLAGGYAVGQASQPLLDPRPGAWNRVGIATDSSGHQTVHINGARAPAAAVYRFRDRLASRPEQRAALRHSLSIGLVRGPAQAMQGAFRCFGVARGQLSARQFHDAFVAYCQ